jgi:TetR/AcrR family transcriptional regulator
MTAKTRDPEVTKAAILDAAEEVFLAHGFAQATTSAIAARAGVTKSLLHHHFGSKEGLWNEVKTRRFAHYANQQLQMLDTSEPTIELLRDSISFYFRFLKANPQMVRILAWIYLEQQGDACEELDRDLTTHGVAKLREAQERGLLRADIDPHFILFTFIGTLQHWFQDRDFFRHHMADPDVTDDRLDEAYLQAFLKIFMEGVRPR